MQGVLELSPGDVSAGISRIQRPQESVSGFLRTLFLNKIVKIPFRNVYLIKKEKNKIPKHQICLVFVVYIKFRLSNFKRLMFIINIRAVAAAITVFISLISLSLVKR